MESTKPLSLGGVLKDLADHTPEPGWRDLVNVAVHYEASNFNVTHAIGCMRLWRDRDKTSPLSVRFAQRAIDHAVRRLQIRAVAS